MKKSIFCKELASIKAVAERFMINPAPYNSLLLEAHRKSVLNASRYYEELVEAERYVSDKAVKGKFTVVGQKRFERLLQRADFVDVEHLGRWVSVAHVCNFPGRTEWLVTLPGIASVVTEKDAW